MVADIHFDYRMAIEAINNGADKIRINPGNIGGTDKIKAVVDAARAKNIPIRVGVNSGSLEKIIKEYTDDVKLLKETYENNTKSIKDIYDKMQYTFQKVGIVKYDAFHEMGGKLSFAICMLDKNDNGCLVNVMHSNNGCFAYIKEIINGESFIELGDEEANALKQAVAGRMGDVELSREVNDIVNN